MIDNDYKKLQRSSNISALLSLVGFVIILGSLAFSYTEIKQKIKIVNELNTKKDALILDIETQKQRYNTLAIEEKKLLSIIDNQKNLNIELTNKEKILSQTIKLQEKRIKELELASSPEAIVAQTKSVKLDGITNKGRQIYDYSIWLQTPILLKDRIKKVDYFFDHPSMLKKHRESKESSNGYSVSYRGWGCLEPVLITVHLTDGEIFKLNFYHCTGDQEVISISTSDTDKEKKGTPH